MEAEGYSAMEKPVLSRDRLQEWICRRFHRVSGQFQDEQGQYERCLDCGRRLPWKDSVPLRDPRSKRAA